MSNSVYSARCSSLRTPPLRINRARIRAFNSPAGPSPAGCFSVTDMTQNVMPPRSPGQSFRAYAERPRPESHPPLPPPTAPAASVKDVQGEVGALAPAVGRATDTEQEMAEGCATTERTRGRL